MAERKGIDVSKHQGVIQWDDVKNDGIDFAIIRLGIGSDIPKQDDPKFEQNVKEAERVGIPWGAYLYSYALTVDEAKSEAAHALRLLKGKKPSYPIYLDMEDADKYKERHGMPPNHVLIDICYTFLDIVEKAGYYVGLYASLSWFKEKLNDPKLDRFDKWVAQWGPKCTYWKPYGMWQYTNQGTVAGISGRVDMNIAYKDYPIIIKSKGLNGWGKTKPIIVNQPEKNQGKSGNTPISGVKTYRIYKTLDGYKTAADAEKRKNPAGKVQPGSYYVFNEKEKAINVTKKAGVPGSWINKDDNKKKKTQTVKKAEYITHTVKRGDTLSEIAQQYGTTISELVKLNSLKNKDLIYAGQKLRIPVKAVYHTVKKGDTVSELAKKYGSSVQQIVQWNKLKDPDVIYVGQKLRVR